MRIVRLANFVMARSGGLRTALRNLGEGYVAAGHEPVLVIPGERYADEQTTAGRIISLPGTLLPGSGGYRLLVGRRRLRRLLEELRPDRLEVSDRFTLRWTARWARAHGVPAAMVSHESLAGVLGTWRVPLRAPLADALNRRSARAYHRVVCTTGWAAAEFSRVGATNVDRVPLGVDLVAFHPGRRDPAMRARFAPPGEPLIVHCSRLSVEKRPLRAVAALRELRAGGVPAVLVVAGDGPLRSTVEREAAGLPVHMLGFISDRSELAALLATADVVVAPGPVETFGLAALEALACGTPVVVSADSALPEVVGTAGVAVSGESFADGVRAVLARDEVERRAAARCRAERFGWAVAVEGFLRVHA